MAGLSKGSGGYKFINIQTKYKDHDQACIVSDGEIYKKLNDVRLLAMRPHEDEWKGKKVEGFRMVVDMSELGDKSELAYVTFSMGGLAKSIINSLVSFFEDLGGLASGTPITFSVWQKGEYGRITLFANDDKISWKFTPEQFQASEAKMGDKYKAWVKIWDKYIKPYLPEDYKADESALAGVAESKNGPVEDDDSFDLPF